MIEATALAAHAMATIATSLNMPEGSAIGGTGAVMSTIAGKAATAGTAMQARTTAKSALRSKAHDLRQ